MNKQIKQFLEFIERYKGVDTKDEMIHICEKTFPFVKDRKVYHTNFFAVRFCYSKSHTFSNTVLSLSALEKYDKIPFFVVLVHNQEDNEIFISNTTFLKKISHSSRELSMTNIKGSFNGSDIIKVYDELSNNPNNFAALFAIHSSMEWEDNLRRLVEASDGITPTSTKFEVCEMDKGVILQSPQRALKFIESEDFNILNNDLNERCNRVKEAIVTASHIENTNIRGRLIEALITSDDDGRNKLLEQIQQIEQELPTYDTKNGLGDFVRRFDDADTYTDIKTKVIYLQSNPKAYNIDKFLRCMAEVKSVLMFYFIGIDEKGIMNTTLCSVFHSSLLSTTRIMSHWSGRSTRGVAQFTGTTIDDILKDHHFANQIDIEASQTFLHELICR